MPRKRRRAGSAQGVPRFARLDRETLDEIQRLIGQILLNMVPAARQLGHASPIHSIVDYLQPSCDESVAFQEASAFVIDFLTMNTVDLIRKWYATNDLELAA